MLVPYRWLAKALCIISLLCISGCALQQKKPTLTTPTDTPKKQANATSWRTQTILESKEDSPYTALIFSPDNQFLITCNQNSVIEIWNMKDHTLYKTWKVKDPIHTFAFSPDGTQLAATTQLASAVYEDKESTLYIWQWPSAQTIHTIHSPVGINFVQYSRDSKTLMTASWRGIINFWDPSSGTLQRSVLPALKGLPLKNAEDDANDYTVQNITLSPDGTFIACTYNHTFYPNYPDMEHERSYDYLTEICVAIWDGIDGKLVNKIDTGLIDYARCAQDNAIMFSPDGMHLATGHLRGALCVINTTDWSIAKLEGYHGQGYGAGRQILTFSPDGTYLAATNLEHMQFPDEKHETVIWNLKTGAIENQYKESHHVAFSFDGKQFALCKKQDAHAPLTIEIVSHA